GGNYIVGVALYPAGAPARSANSVGNKGLGVCVGVKVAANRGCRNNDRGGVAQVQTNATLGPGKGPQVDSCCLYKVVFFPGRVVLRPETCGGIVANCCQNSVDKGTPGEGRHF